jgi:hypothetical protein
LSFPWLSPLIDSDNPSPAYFDGFDDVLSDDPGFVAHLERFARHVDGCLSAGQPVLVLHPCHPVKTYTLDWIDNYITPNGVNVPPEQWPARPGPGLRSPAQMELAMRNFRRLAQFIRRHARLNVLSLPEATAKYGRLPAEIGRVDLLAAAQRACALDEVAIQERDSPAEVIMGWAGALLAYAGQGHLPETLPRSEVLGPLEDPLIIPEERGELGWPALLDLAAALQAAAGVSGHLPANLSLPGGARVGLGSLYRALAEAYLLTAQAAQPPETVTLMPFDRQPRIGPAIGRRYAQIAESPLVAPNLNADRLYRLGKLQTWTLAPAWPQAFATAHTVR